MSFGKGKSSFKSKSIFTKYFKMLLLSDGIDGKCRKDYTPDSFL